MAEAGHVGVRGDGALRELEGAGRVLAEAGQRVGDVVPADGAGRRAELALVDCRELGQGGLVGLVEKEAGGARDAGRRPIAGAEAYAAEQPVAPSRAPRAAGAEGRVGEAAQANPTAESEGEGAEHDKARGGAPHAKRDRNPREARRGDPQASKCPQNAPIVADFAVRPAPGSNFVSPRPPRGCAEGAEDRPQPWYPPPMSAQLVQIGRRSAAPHPEVESGEAPALYLETYGCQMNVADSELLVDLLAAEGFRRAGGPEDADVILLNTCAVREKAEERVYARAAELSAQKRRRPNVVLGITGCMAEHLKGELRVRAPYVDLVAGPDSYRRIAVKLRKLRSAEGEREAVVDVKLDKAETYEGLAGATGGDGVSAFITIQRGCDKFCTFCVVPYTRGRERGVAPRDILRQARLYAEKGYREIVLLGQTVNSYRYEDVDFAKLLRAVARVDGIERVRFTSPYPVDFTADVIDTIASHPKICGYLHLPLQSGSDEVLARMRRGYTVDEFRALVRAIRAAMPEVALSTDILSGFSGETDACHEQTLELMRELRFDSAFMFSYSERELTVSARKLPDDVPPDLKKARLREIIALQEEISREVFSLQVGKIEEVLVHSASRRNPEELMGRTGGFKSVIFPRGHLKPGDLARVQIERATMATLFGSVVAPRAKS